MPILCVLKYYHAFKNFNEVYTGGISSYALALMLIYYFKTQSAQEILALQQDESYKTGLLFFGFLDLFSDHDFVDNNVITVGKHTKIQHYIHPGDSFSRPYLKIRDEYSRFFQFISFGSYRSKIILDDFGVLAKSLRHANANAPNPLLAQHFVLPDALVGYRSVLHLVFRVSFHLFVSIMSLKRLLFSIELVCESS